MLADAELARGLWCQMFKVAGALGRGPGELFRKLAEVQNNLCSFTSIRPRKHSRAMLFPVVFICLLVNIET